MRLTADPTSVGFAGGAFGRHLFGESAIEAALVSQALGIPIKLMWTRNDDMRHGRLRPASHHKVRATHLLGSVIAYEHRHAPEVRVNEDGARVYQEVPGSQCPAPYTDPDLCHPAFLGQPSPAVNAGTYRANSNVLSLDLLYRF